MNQQSPIQLPPAQDTFHVSNTLWGGFSFVVKPKNKRMAPQISRAQSCLIYSQFKPGYVGTDGSLGPKPLMPECFASFYGEYLHGVLPLETRTSCESCPAFRIQYMISEVRTPEIEVPNYYQQSRHVEVRKVHQMRVPRQRSTFLSPLEDDPISPLVVRLSCTQTRPKCRVWSICRLQEQPRKVW